MKEDNNIHKIPEIYKLIFWCLSSTVIGIICGILSYTIFIASNKSQSESSIIREKIDSQISDIKHSFSQSIWCSDSTSTLNSKSDSIEKFDGISKIMPTRLVVDHFKSSVLKSVELWEIIGEYPDKNSFKTHTDYLIEIENFMMKRNIFIESVENVFHITSMMDSIIIHSNNANRLSEESELNAIIKSANSMQMLFEQLLKAEKKASEEMISRLQVSNSLKDKDILYVLEPLEKMQQDPDYYRFVSSFFEYCYGYNLLILQINDSLRD